jgi:hypothetical protein
MLHTGGSFLLLPLFCFRDGRVLATNVTITVSTDQVFRDLPTGTYLSVSIRQVFRDLPVGIHLSVSMD